MLLGKTRRWVLCLSVFLCFLSPCKICVPVVFTGTSLPCGQGATSGTREDAELLSVIRATINWQRRLIGLLSFFKADAFLVTEKRMTLCPRAQAFVVIALWLLILHVPAQVVGEAAVL